MTRSRTRRCAATLDIDNVIFHCERFAGHSGRHEEGGKVDEGNYREYEIRWRGDSRDSCDTCFARTEHIVECLNCGSMVCLNCRDPKASEELRNVCKECPPEEEGDES